MSLFVCNEPVSAVLRSVANDRHEQVRFTGIQPSCDSSPCKRIGGRCVRAGAEPACLDGDCTCEESMRTGGKLGNVYRGRLGTGSFQDDSAFSTLVLHR